MPLKRKKNLSIEPHVRIHKHAPPIRLNHNSKTNSNILLLKKSNIIHIYCHENIYSIKKKGRDGECLPAYTNGSILSIRL